MKKLLILLAVCSLGMTVSAQHLGTEYRLKKIIPVAGRQGIAIDDKYYYVSDTRVLYKYTKDGTLVMKNDKPFQKPELANHFGDIDVWNGEIYTGNDVAGWMDVTVNYDVRNYGVYVDGKELTSLNFYDIPGLKSGTAYLMDEPEGIGWSGYLPTLVLSDAKIEGEEGIRNELAYFLKIIVKGDNEVTATDFNAFSNNTAGVETVFSGGGTVRFTATGDHWNGIYAIDSRVTLKEATTIMAKGDGMGYLDDNSTLVIQEGSTLMGYGNKYPSVELPLADQRKWASDIQIRYPVGAYIGDGYHVYYAGTTTDVQKEWVVIGPEGAVPPEEGTNYDLNGDGKVSTADIQIIINEMKKTQASQNMKYDLNGDGKISTADIQVIINEMKK